MSERMCGYGWPKGGRFHEDFGPSENCRWVVFIDGGEIYVVTVVVVGCGLGARKNAEIEVGTRKGRKTRSM